MSGDDADDATYLDEVVEETPVLFASSEAVLTIEDPNLHPMGKATAIFLLFTCLLGFLNGLDYASPEDGLVRPDEFVYRLALTAPDDTATFRGSVVDDEGQPMVNATVYLSWLDDATDVWVSEENLTDDAGAFSFEKLDPGLIRVDIIVERDDHRDVFSNRVLLSPPALIEPIGFTTIDFMFPSSDTFAAQPCEREVGRCEIRTVDRTLPDGPSADGPHRSDRLRAGRLRLHGRRAHRSRLRRMGAQIRFNRAFANFVRFGVFHHATTGARASSVCSRSF